MSKLGKSITRMATGQIIDLTIWSTWHRARTCCMPMHSRPEGAVELHFQNRWCGGGVEQRSGHLVRQADKRQSSLGWPSLWCLRCVEERHQIENLRYNLRMQPHQLWLAKSGGPCWIQLLVIKCPIEWLVRLAVWCPKQDWLAKGHWRGQATITQV